MFHSEIKMRIIYLTFVFGFPIYSTLFPFIMSLNYIGFDLHKVFIIDGTILSLVIRSCYRSWIIILTQILISWFELSDRLVFIVLVQAKNNQMAPAIFLMWITREYHCIFEKIPKYKVIRDECMHKILKVQMETCYWIW